MLSTLISIALAVPLVLYLCRLLLKRQQSSYPSWKNIDADELKRGGSAKKLEAAADADVIIIGSGLGGLSSAAVLSKAGYKVVVLEQHDVIGGATHTFEDGGYEFDVGIHYLGGEMDSFLSPVRRLFAAISDGQLEWSKCDRDYDVCHNASTAESIPFCGEVATDPNPDPDPDPNPGPQLSSPNLDSSPAPTLRPRNLTLPRRPRTKRASRRPRASPTRRASVRRCGPTARRSSSPTWRAY